jgi:hypothetical protein
MYRNTDHLLKKEGFHSQIWYPLKISTDRKAQFKPTVQCLNNRSHGHNLRSTPGQADPIAQYFDRSESLRQQ